MSEFFVCFILSTVYPPLIHRGDGLCFHLFCWFVLLLVVVVVVVISVIDEEKYIYIC